MKICTRLLAGFSVVIVISAAMGFFAMTIIGRTSGMTGELYDRPMMATDFHVISPIAPVANALTLPVLPVLVASGLVLSVLSLGPELARAAAMGAAAGAPLVLVEEGAVFGAGAVRGASRTSRLMIRPSGPVPRTVLRSMPRSSARTPRCTRRPEPTAR